ncbi:two component transcriptional regulator, LuxR family [Streptomyces sp. DvalAA-14]|uniref:response regulator transcription factor n=1 Tax=unclassified Streptomyces TaxID=2593676 RepID=UPI00081BAC88|nr:MULTISPECIES: response regulator transcription factor [unclassified Streptomyces]MYS19079.1 DNA-binding response regulator [Streptomyces sp. SID4948]SCD36131.1 two component transcriptional regulator, LuxR family [Streptomyces sp. DvalAA-14]
MPHISRIAIVEHHNLVRRGLEDLVSNSPLLRVVAVVAEPWQLDPAAPPPEVIVLGPSPQAEETLPDVVGKLARYGRVLVVSDFSGPQPVAGALRAGAYGCVTRHTDDDGLLLAIGTVARGGLHVAPGLAARLHAELAQPTAVPPPTLARRETETLRWLAAGLTHGQIARRMDLTEATVSTYVKRIRNKLNVGNKADLTRKAIELGLVREGAEPPGAGQVPYVPRS